MKLKLSILLLLGISSQVFSQTASFDILRPKKAVFTLKNSEKDSVSKEKELSELVVSALRTATNRFSTAEAIDVINAKNMGKLQSRTTPEALTNINGVFVQKTNHGGGSPFVRGLTGNQTLLLVDGVRLSNATFRYGPNQYFNTIDPLSIERIEVLRGGGSVQYGSDALGGTIQVFSKNPEFSTQNTFNGRLFGKVTTQGMEQTGRGELGFSKSKSGFNGWFQLSQFWRFGGR